MDQVYAESMRNHSYGRALYEPESSLVLKPATCGYFSKTGTWTPLLHLSNAAQLASFGLTPFDNRVEQALPSIRKWAPRVSSRVKHQVLDLKAKVR